MPNWSEYRGNSARTAALPHGRPARDLNGNQKWAIDLRNAEVLKGGIRIYNDLVFIGRSDGVSVLDTTTGDQRWNFTDLVPECGFCIVNGVPYYLVGADNDEIRLVYEGKTDRVWSDTRLPTDELNGELGERHKNLLYLDNSGDTHQIRSNPLLGDYYYELPNIDAEPIGTIASDSNVVFCTSKNAYNGVTWGDQLTIISSDDTISHVPVDHQVSSPVIGPNESIFVQEFDAASTLIDSPTSHVKYTPNGTGSFNRQEVIIGCVHTRAPILANNQLYIIDGYGDIVHNETDELVALSYSLDELWRKELPKNLMRKDPDPIAVGEVVYIALGDLLIAFDDTGTHVSQRQFDERITALAGGEPGVYVGTESSVYALTDVSDTVIYLKDRCPNCQTELFQHEDPEYCPDCGEDL